MISIADLREILGADIITYQQLMSALKVYKKPRDKVTRLLARGDLVRVRQGLYIFGEKFRRRVIDRYVLANLIYGPSYISFESALSHHGLIPERVESVSSATTGKNRRFVTPFGLFTYRTQVLPYYAEGVMLEERSWGGALVATPEKALADHLLNDPSAKIQGQKELEHYLLEDLRIDRERLQKMSVARFKKIAQASGAPLLRLLEQYVKKIKKS